MTPQNRQKACDKWHLGVPSVFREYTCAGREAKCRNCIVCMAARNKARYSMKKRAKPRKVPGVFGPYENLLPRLTWAPPESLTHGFQS